MTHPKAAPLRIYALGPPRAEWMGLPLAVPRRQARALLFYLAASRQPVPRQTLAFLFWPDSSETDARRHFTRLLTHLRRALPDPELLEVATEHVGLNLLQTWSDVAEFECLVATHDPNLRPNALQQAVDLYRGPFLIGLSLQDSPEFEAWIRQEQRAQERLYLEALDLLIEDCSARRMWREAIAYAQRYLETDDLAERIHRRLIELYALDGDRAAALRQFERCAAVLERELGVSPLPETRAAYQTVLESTPVVTVMPVALPPPAWTTLPSLDAPLVGRDESLECMQRACEKARQGHGGVILIAGEPGIGKSRLMQEFVTGLRSEATVMAGNSREAEQELPYRPLIEAFSAHVPAMGQAALKIEPRYLAQMAHILPGLRTLPPNLPTAGAVRLSLEQSYLFDSVVRWLQTVAVQRPPLVLCLDNLHWADEGTLAFLAYLAARIRDAPILVLATYRREGTTVIGGLRVQLAPLGLLQEITLAGLTQADVLHLIRHLSGQTDGAELFSQRLQRETGGNPLFLLETLRAMLEAGILWPDATGWNTSVDEITKDYGELPLPNALSRTILDRVSRLTLQVRQVLEASAVIGPQFDLDLVCETSGRSEAEVVDALDVLLAHQLISEQEGSYRFNHELMRNLVYHDLSYGRRRLLHRRAAEALVQRPSADVAALAWHFERAEEPRRAAEYALRASRHARAVFAYATARVQCNKALMLLQREAADLRQPEQLLANQRLQIQALHERGWVLRLLGEMEAYAFDSQEMARLAGLLGDTRSSAQARWREAHAHRWFCRYAQALAVAEEGLQLSQVAGDPLSEAICWREVGLAAREMGDYRRAQTALERALGIFVGLNNTEYEIHVLGNLSTLHYVQGEYEDAMALASRELARCKQAGLSWSRRLALGDMGAAAVALGRIDEAQVWLQESLAIARQVADRTQEILCLGHLGWAHIQLRQPAQAFKHLKAALALAEHLDSRSEQSWLHAGLAEAHRLKNAAAEARRHAHKALALSETLGRAYDRKLATQVLAALGTAG